MLESIAHLGLVRQLVRRTEEVMLKDCAIKLQAQRFTESNHYFNNLKLI